MSKTTDAAVKAVGWYFVAVGIATILPWVLIIGGGIWFYHSIEDKSAERLARENAVKAP